MAQQPEGGAAVDAPVTYEDDESAAAALEKLMFPEEEEGEPDDPEAEESDPEGDEPEGEEDEAEEDGDDDEDEPEQPAIAPPASLTAEEKANWQQLPPEAQQAIVAIEARRTAEVQTGLEKARNAQREAETAAASRIAEAERLHAEQLAKIGQAYAPQPPDPQLARSNPGLWIAQKAEYDALAAQHGEFMQQVEAIRESATQEQERLEADAVKAMWAEVANDLPEARDPAQWQELMVKLSPVAIEVGYPEELLADATPRDIRAIKRAAAWKEKADKYDSLMSRKMATVRAGKKSAKPNAAQPLGSGKARASVKATERLRQTGSVDDAAAALALRI